MIIDLDSHLRDHSVMDEVYQLEAPYEDFNPVRKVGPDGKVHFETKFPHLQSEGNMRAYDHSYMYDPKENWRGGELAKRQIVGTDMAKRVELNAAEQLDKQVIFPTGISLPAMTEGGLGAALSRSYNNWVSNLVKGFENQLLPVAIMPAGDPESMPGELRRCVNELGLKCAHLVSYNGDRNLDNEAFFPFYEAAQELDVPLFCHPNGQFGFITERFNNFLAMHTLGRPTNCTQALVGLVAGGIFEKFPDLKVCFFEVTAEWPLYWMHRMDDDFEWLRDDQDRHLPIHLNMTPSDYMRRNCYVTLEADENPAALRQSLDEFGEDHILMATDYPHFDSEYPHTVSKLQANAVLSNTQKEKILGENARKLLHV